MERGCGSSQSRYQSKGREMNTPRTKEKVKELMEVLEQVEQQLDYGQVDIAKAIIASIKELKLIKELMREPSEEMLKAVPTCVIEQFRKYIDDDSKETWKWMSAALLAQVEREIRDE